jgi:hypothetical protein
VDELFSAQGIAYVVMKGVHVRECIYPDPAVRPASDIDILIAPQDRRRAAQLLLDNGYTAQVLPNNVSFEASFRKGPVDIDLHWSMLREGRTRVDLTAGLLARRQQTHGVWGLSDSDAVFMMVTHPAFGKYVCSPNMGLGRVADFMQWMQQKPVDWPAVRGAAGAGGPEDGRLDHAELVPDAGATRRRPEIDDGGPRCARAPAGGVPAIVADPRPAHPALAARAMDSAGLHAVFCMTGPADMLRVLHGVWHARRHRLRDARLLMGDDYEWGAGRDA